MKAFPFRPRESRERHDVKKKIIELYQELKRMAPPFLASQSTLALQLESLDIMSQEEPERSFFSLLSQEYYNKFPLVEALDSSVRMEGMRISMDPALSENAVTNADNIFLSFAWLASYAQRRDISKDDNGLTSNLGYVNGWSFQEGFMKSVVDRERFGHGLLTDCHRLAGYWIRLTDMDKKPHIILATIHSIDGDGRLLKGDVLAILAALQTRMDCAELQKHMVMPILLFSFMGYHATIMEAYHNGDRLIIRQSPLLKFDDYDTAPIDVLVRYLACEAVGDTKQFPQKKPEEMQQIQDPSRRNTFRDRFSIFGRQSKRKLATASSIFIAEETKTKRTNSTETGEKKTGENGNKKEKENGNSSGKSNGTPSD